MIIDAMVEHLDAEIEQQTTALDRLEQAKAIVMGIEGAAVRRRGRPLGAKNRDADTIKEDARKRIQAKADRGPSKRGRPKGSKNKTVSTLLNMDVSTPPMDVPDDSMGVLSVTPSLLDLEGMAPYLDRSDTHHAELPL